MRRTKSPVLPASNPAVIRIAAEILHAGGLVAFPTETVYGLGANALNPGAVARLYEVKGRPRFDPLIVHIADLEALEMLALEVSQWARWLVDRFWPGPLTLVLPKRPCVPDLVTAGLLTVAVRMPAHPVARALIREAGIPVAAPSANPFGYVSPTRARHVLDGLGGQVDLVLDGGPCSYGVESTVVSVAGVWPQLLRPGAITIEEIKSVIGPVERGRPAGSRPEAPGQLVRHYATRTPLYLLPRPGAVPFRAPGERIGLLAFAPSAAADGFAVVEVLSKRGSLREAARNLFAALRRLDAQRLDRLYAEPCEERGLGQAIMDRLRRCAVPAPALAIGQPAPSPATGANDGRPIAEGEAAGSGRR